MTPRMKRTLLWQQKQFLCAMNVATKAANGWENALPAERGTPSLNKKSPKQNK